MYAFPTAVAGAALWATVSIGLASPAGAQPRVIQSRVIQSRAIVGQVGLLGEWELTAAVAAPEDGGHAWNGPLSLKHVGFCGADGPEEKTGELRLSIPGPPGEVTAMLVIGERPARSRDTGRTTATRVS